MLKKIFRQKNKKTVTIMAAILAAGVLLMMAEDFLGGAGRARDAPLPDTVPLGDYTAPPGQAASAELETRLEEALSLVAGAGNVRVLINFSAGRELVVAIDQTVSASVTQEEDSEGGTRYQNNRNGQYSTVIITGRTGENTPLILKELEPPVAGVIIIAEGGDDVFVRDALTRAAGTLLGIDLSRVHVMQMRKLP